MDTRLVRPSAVDQLWDRWPYLSNAERLKQFRVMVRDWFRVVRRELISGIALGVILGAIGMMRIFVWQKLFDTYGAHTAILALTIFLALIGVVTFGTLAGSMLPFVLRRMGLNPASASAPFVATLVDVTGLIIYFTIANFIMLRQLGLS
jgi:magnesium transporter